MKEEKYVCVDELRTMRSNIQKKDLQLIWWRDDDDDDLAKRGSVVAYLGWNEYSFTVGISF